MTFAKCWRRSEIVSAFVGENLGQVTVLPTYSYGLPSAQLPKPCFAKREDFSFHDEQAKQLGAASGNESDIHAEAHHSQAKAATEAGPVE